MPIQITLTEALVKGFDELMPDEFQSFSKAIEADPADEGRQKIFADWLDEQGESDLAYGLRWCAARHLRPRYRREYGSKKWGWVKWWEIGDKHAHPRSMPPAVFRDELEKCTADSFIGVIAKTSLALLAVRETMFGIAPEPLPEPEPQPEPEDLDRLLPTTAIPAETGEELPK